MGLLDGIGQFLLPLAQGASAGTVKGEQAKISMENQKQSQLFRQAQLQALIDYHNAQVKEKAGADEANAKKVLQQGLFKYAAGLDKVMLDPTSEDIRSGLERHGYSPDMLGIEARNARAAALSGNPGSFVPHFTQAFSVLSGGGDFSPGALKDDGSTTNPTAGPGTTPGKSVMLAPHANPPMVPDETVPPSVTPQTISPSPSLTQLFSGVPGAAAGVDLVNAFQQRTPSPYHLPPTVAPILGPPAPPGSVSTQYGTMVPSLTNNKPPSVSIPSVVTSQPPVGASPTDTTKVVPKPRFPTSPKTQSIIDANNASVGVRGAVKGLDEAKTTTEDLLRDPKLANLDARTGLTGAQTDQIYNNEDLAERKFGEIVSQDKVRQGDWEKTYNAGRTDAVAKQRFEGRMAAVAEGHLALNAARNPGLIKLDAARAAAEQAKLDKAVASLSDADKAILRGVGPIRKPEIIKGIPTGNFITDPVAASVYDQMLNTNLKAGAAAEAKGQPMPQLVPPRKPPPPPTGGNTGIGTTPQVLPSTGGQAAPPVTKPVQPSVPYKAPPQTTTQKSYDEQVFRAMAKQPGTYARWAAQEKDPQKIAHAQNVFRRLGITPK